MFTPDKKKEGKVFANPIQEPSQRLSIYSINKCEDQVIGFEFVSSKYVDDPTCHNNVLINICIPIEVITPIVIERAEFWATDDPCNLDYQIKKKEEPSLELVKNQADEVTGIIVRFCKSETCCVPVQMAFKLIGIDSNGLMFSIARGLLLFK